MTSRDILYSLKDQLYTSKDASSANYQRTLEVLQGIKGDPRTRPIPVVVLTSSHEERDIVESYRLGVNSYITKLVDFEQFTEAVRTLGMYWILLNQQPVLPG